MLNKWDFFLGVRWGWAKSQMIGFDAGKDHRGAWHVGLTVYWRVFGIGCTAKGNYYVRVFKWLALGSA